MHDPLSPPLTFLLLFLTIENDALAPCKCGNSHFSAVVQTQTPWGYSEKLTNCTWEMRIFVVRETAVFGNFPHGVEVISDFFFLNIMTLFEHLV